MSSDIPAQYDPKTVERPIYERWLARDAFAAVPDDREERFVVMMPLPNVTGALHMGHAMDNVMQDLLVRWRRMRGANTLWQPGTDHAGIATQAVVEKRLFELEGKTRHDVGRDGLVRRIWQWKDQYQQRIVRQQQAMGCSCDWKRQRFTMDPVCRRAVREVFFRLFRDRLVYRGLRLVNWDCHLRTAVSDDEVDRKTVAGKFWHLRYPVIDPQDDEPRHVVVATTRPETMLGDTAVAVHPDPAGALEKLLTRLRERLERAPAKEKAALAAEIERVEERRREKLPELEKLAEMARRGRRVLLPLQEREIPLLLDEWAKPELGSGCVKITPAHDPNDYEVWTRHRDEIDIVNILEPDGRLNENAGPYRGLDRFEARERVVSDLDERGLLERTEEREIELGISDRSKTPIEPYLSKQWFVRTGDVEGGVVFGRGTDREFRAAGLAQAALDAVDENWASPSGLRLTFHPDGDRYRQTYVNWLSEKRDWCIGRQLWWGHRIPIWSREVDANDLIELAAKLPPSEPERLVGWVGLETGEPVPIEEALRIAREDPGRGPFEIEFCPRDEEAEKEIAPRLEELGLRQEEDVLDTWFSSALWPFSTLGWPDPDTAPIGAGERDLTGSLDYYYPGSCLVTGRDIITLWVARMVMLGLYCLGDLPFHDCFLHANILDGKGERMSKSKGNGIDPVDIIDRYGADAMRYVLCEMQTGVQDIRLPVQAISPYTGSLVDLATAKHGRTIFTYICPETGKEFDVLGTLPELPQAQLVSDRFEVGRHFCNKLWNAARFALLRLGEDVAVTEAPLERSALAPEDRWILSRLERTRAQVDEALSRYCPAAALGAARDFFWNELCDWYLEAIKARLAADGGDEAAHRVLAFALDRVLRLFHPFVPFLTEALWEKLGRVAPARGLDAPAQTDELLCLSTWPEPRPQDLDEDAEGAFALLQGVVRGVRDLKARHGVAPQHPVPVEIAAAGAARSRLEPLLDHVRRLARAESVRLRDEEGKPRLAATAVVGAVEVFVLGLLDPEKERARLDKQRRKLESQTRSIEAKLANERFLERAPTEVVENERRRLAEARAELATLAERLRELQEG